MHVRARPIKNPVGVAVVLGLMALAIGCQFSPEWIPGRSAYACQLPPHEQTDRGSSGHIPRENQNEKAAHSVLKPVPVLLVARFEKSATWTATGFIIARNAIVTARHALLGASELEIVDGNKVSEAKVVWTDPISDVALLAIGPIESIVVPSSASAILRPGTKLTVHAESKDTLARKTVMLRSYHCRYGVIKTLQLGGDICPGDSGSPVLDDDGNVVAMIVELATVVDGTSKAGEAIAIDLVAFASNLTQHAQDPQTSVSAWNSTVACSVTPQQIEEYSQVVEILKKGEFEQSLELSRALCKQVPCWKDANLVMIASLIGSKQFDQAQKVLESPIAWECEGERDVVRSMLAMGAEGPVRGVRVAAQLWELHKSPELAEMLATGLVESGKEQEAIGMLRDAQKMFAYDPRPCATLAELAIRKNDVKLLREACVQWSTREFVDTPRRHLSAAIFSEGDREGGLAAAKAACEEIQDSALLWANLANMHYAMGKHDSALAAVDKALEFDPKNVDLMKLQIRCLIYVGRSDDALKVIDRAEQLSPSDEWLGKIRQALSR